MPLVSFYNSKTDTMIAIKKKLDAMILKNVLDVSYSTNVWVCIFIFKISYRPTRHFCIPRQFGLRPIQECPGRATLRPGHHSLHIP